MDTKDNKIDTKWYIVIVLIVLLFLTNVFLVNKILKQESKFDNYEKTISALNDSVHVVIKNGQAFYSQKAPEINLNDLVNSEYFKTLSDNQKKFYNDLKNIKGLISATQAELSKQGVSLAELSLKAGGGTLTSNGDSLKFKYGQVLNFKEQDTTKKLQWKADVALKNPLDCKLTYDYKFKVSTTFERKKDKSIVVNYSMDDPELKVNNMQNFIIPKEEKRTALGRWLDKNKRPLQIAAGSVLFLGGGYLGFMLAK